MLRITTALAMVLAFTVAAYAQGTAEEAKAMLMKVAAAVKADPNKTIQMINDGTSGFLDRDLYAFCADLKTGKGVANASNNAKQTIGMDVKDIKDATGKLIGPDLLAGMQKPEISEVNYMYPRPGADKTPVQKTSLVMKVTDDLGCGVGYYK